MTNKPSKLRSTRRPCIIWSDIGAYHATRSKAANEILEGGVDSIEIFGRSEFPEFRDLPMEIALSFPRHSLNLQPFVNANSARRSLYRKLDELHPNVVFTLGWSVREAILPIEWCVSRGIPFVLMSESTSTDFQRNAIKEGIKRRIVQMASAALVGGHPQSDYVTDLGVPKERIFLGYDAVDNDYFLRSTALIRQSSDRLRLKHNLPKQYFLCCARLIEKKNLIRLVQAYHIYRRTRDITAWKLVIVGPGPMQAALKAEIEKLNLHQDVHLLGARNYSDMPIYYGLASAFILPSTMDQWGLVVNEAMASGLPVLVSERCGSAHDLVQQGKNGFTFNPYDVSAIAETMRRIASEYWDLTSMGAASQAIIANWGPARFASGFAAAVEVAIKAPMPKAQIIDRLLLRVLASR